MSIAPSSVFKPGLVRLGLAMIVYVHHVSRFSLGSTAVYVFFMLSGYWISKMWKEKYSTFQKPLMGFFASRFIRLIPVFILANLIVLCINYYMDKISFSQPSSGALWWVHNIFSNLFILGYSSLETKPLGSSWSLDIEMQFYFLAPLLIASISSRPKMWLIVALATSMISSYVFGDAVFLTFSVFFIFGIIAQEINWQPSSQLAVYSLAAFLIAVVALLLIPPLRNVLLGGAHPSAVFIKYNGILNILLAFLLAPIAMFSVHQKSNQTDSMWGDFSYIIYLLHWPAVSVVSWSYGDLPPVQRLPYVIIAAAVVFITTFCVWKYYDKPLNLLRGKVIRRFFE